MLRFARIFVYEFPGLFILCDQQKVFQIQSIETRNQNLKYLRIIKH